MECGLRPRTLTLNANTLANIRDDVFPISNRIIRNLVFLGFDLTFPVKKAERYLLYYRECSDIREQVLRKASSTAFRYIMDATASKLPSMVGRIIVGYYSHAPEHMVINEALAVGLVCQKQYIFSCFSFVQCSLDLINILRKDPKNQRNITQFMKVIINLVRVFYNDKLNLSGLDDRQPVQDIENLLGQFWKFEFSSFENEFFRLLGIALEFPADLLSHFREAYLYQQTLVQLIFNRDNASALTFFADQFPKNDIYVNFSTCFVSSLNEGAPQVRSILCEAIEQDDVHVVEFLVNTLKASIWFGLPESPFICVLRSKHPNSKEIRKMFIAEAIKEPAMVEQVFEKEVSFKNSLDLWDVIDELFEAGLSPECLHPLFDIFDRNASYLIFYGVSKKRIKEIFPKIGLFIDKMREAEAIFMEVLRSIKKRHTETETKEAVDSFDYAALSLAERVDIARLCRIKLQEILYARQLEALTKSKAANFSVEAPTEEAEEEE